MRGSYDSTMMIVRASLHSRSLVCILSRMTSQVSDLPMLTSCSPVVVVDVVVVGVVGVFDVVGAVGVVVVVVVASRN